jgi:hypothetical protein
MLSRSRPTRTAKLPTTTVLDSDDEEEDYPEPIHLSLANVSLDTTIECNETMTGTYGCFFTPDQIAWKKIVNYQPGGLSVYASMIEPDKSRIEVKIDMNDWVTYMQNHGTPLGLKVFKSSRSAWVDEMRESLAIYSVLGQRYTTNVPVRAHGRDVIGFRLQVNDGRPLFDVRFKTEQTNNPIRNELFVIPALACQESLSSWRPPAPRHSSRASSTSASTSTTPSLFEMTDMVFDALETLHKGGFAHMDVKPANIVYCPNTSPCVKLIDFGMAISIGPGAALKSKGCSPMFASPLLPNINGIKSVDYHYRDAWITGIIARLRNAHMESYTSTRRPTHDDDLREIYKKHDMWGATLSMIYVYYNGYSTAGYTPEQLEAWVSGMERAVSFTGAPQKRSRSSNGSSRSRSMKRVKETVGGGKNKPKPNSRK